MRNKRGITLISLVISIVILLILSGVSISLVVGNNGILNKAKSAVEKYSNSEIEEQIKMAYQEYQMVRFTGTDKPDQQYIQDSLSNTLKTDVDVNKMGRNYKIEIEDKVYMLRYDGTIKQTNKIETMAVTDIYWKFDSGTGILHLSATDLGSYTNKNDANWSSYIENIITVKIENPIAPNALSFNNYINLKNIQNINYLHTENITNMASMFYNCKLLENLDVSGFDTSKVTSMSSMFDGCEQVSVLDVSNFDTSKVTSMLSMFSGCSAIQALDLSSFDTKNTTDMNRMFNGCSSLISIDISGFDTSSITSMFKMFNNCSSLNKIEIANINTERVTAMGYMFMGCSSLTNINLNGINTSNVTSMDYMFYGCSSISNLDLSNFDTVSVTSYIGMMSNVTAKVKLGPNWNSAMTASSTGYSGTQWNT